MSELKLPCPVGQVSDGYHTFDELYEHRHALMLAFMSVVPWLGWYSEKHADGSTMPGWFIVGLNLPEGTVTYHLPNRLWNNARATGVKHVELAPEWDRHTSEDVIFRLKRFSEQPKEAIL